MTSKTSEQLEQIVRQIVAAVAEGDLTPIGSLCANKAAVQNLLPDASPDLDQKTIDEANRRVNQTHKGIENCQSTLSGQADLTPLIWRWQERSKVKAVCNEASVFFAQAQTKKSDRIWVIEFSTLEIEGENLIFGEFEIQKLATPLDRQLDVDGEEFQRFQTQTQWPSLSTLQAEAFDLKGELLDIYQKISIESDDDPSSIEFSDTTEAQWQQVESQIGRRFPAELTDWWANQEFRQVRSYDWGYGFGIFSPQTMQEMMANQELTHSVSQMGLAEVLDYYHSGEFKELLSSEDFDALNQQYRVIGYYHLNDSDALYLYFDENDQFGLIEYDHDWRHFNGVHWNAEFRTLLRRSRASERLHSLVAGLFTLSAFELWQAMDE